jgi:flagellar biosynthesis protein
MTQKKRLTQREGFKRIKKTRDELVGTKKRSAIAVKYDVEGGKAPKIMATGQGNIADMILQVAEENRIPFFEDSSLVDLLSKLDLDSEIPPELYTLVAEVLAFVYQLDKLAKKRQKVQKKYGNKGKKD